MKIIFSIAFLLCALAFSSDEAKFTDYDSVHGLGLKRDIVKFEAMKKSAVSKGNVRLLKRGAVKIPGKFNWANKVSPPEDQGSHGSCWDFGIIKDLRSEWMLVGKDPGQLSFNYLLCDNHTQYSCDSGGDFDAMDVLLNGKGPWLAKNDPYPNCSGRCVKGQPVAASAKRVVVVGPGNRPPTFEENAEFLWNNGNGHVGVIDGAVCGQWGNYNSGVLRKSDCGPNSINHIINRVGLNCESSVDKDGFCVFGPDGDTINHDGYFVDMNNWGSWGEQGYIREGWMVDAFGDTVMYFDIGVEPPPTPIDGGWSTWSAWGACDNQVQNRTRTCTNPVPSNGGKDCLGASIESQPCGGPNPPTPSGDLPVWVWIVLASVGLIAVVEGIILLVKKS